MKRTRQVDLQSGVIQWSDETFRIFGFAPGTVVPTRDDFYSRVHPDDREFVRSAVEENNRTGRPYQEEHRITSPDGSLRYVSERAELAHSSDKNPERLVGTVLDITAIKNVELALKRSEQHFRTRPRPDHPGR